MYSKIPVAVVLAALAGAVAFGTPAKLSAATKLTLVYPFPDFLVYTKNCKALAEKTMP